MHEKYVIPSNLIKLDGETLVSLDLASGEKNTFQIGEYDFDINGTSVISDGNSIYLFAEHGIDFQLTGIKSIISPLLQTILFSSFRLILKIYQHFQNCLFGNMKKAI